MIVLDGITVIEVGNFITAPFAGMLLADLGASVIKVERPDGGDPSGTVLSDPLTGIYACNGILGALVRRARTGLGCRVEVNMLEATMAFIDLSFTEYFISGEAPGPYHKSKVNQSFALKCQDGRLVAIHLSSPEKFWQNLVEAINAEDLLRDPRFASREKRIENYELLRGELNEIFASKPRSFWEGELSKH